VKVFTTLSEDQLVSELRLSVKDNERGRTGEDVPWVYRDCGDGDVIRVKSSLELFREEDVRHLGRRFKNEE